MVIRELKNSSFNNFRYYKRILLLLIASVVLSCGSDDPNDMDEPINLPPVMNGEIQISFGPEGVTFNWAVATDPENDPISSYIVNISDKDIGSSNPFLSQFVGVPTTTSYTRILPTDKTYRIEITAKDINGNESENQLEIEFDYTNSGPTAVTNITFNKGTSSATISWDPSTDPDNDAIVYQLELIQYTDFPADLPQTIETFTTSNTIYTVDGLQLLYKYSIRITAIDNSPFLLESEPTNAFFAILPPGDTFNGDISLRSQSDVDIFIGHTYQTINGNLTTTNYLFDQLPDITDLSVFDPIEVITGDLYLKIGGEYGFNATALNSFGNVQTINGSLFIVGGAGVLVDPNEFSSVDLSVFENLQSVQNLILSNNHGGLNGEFPLLETVSNNLQISGNGNYTIGSIVNYEFSFPMLQSVGGDFGIGDNPQCSAINGLNNIQSIGGDFIYSEHNTISDMSSLTSIGSNFNIANVSSVDYPNAFSNLTTIGGDLIFNKVDFQETYNLSSVNSIGGAFIFDNTYQNNINYLPNFNTPINLSSLQTIGTDIYIKKSLFSNLDFLQNITTVNNLTLIHNPSLTETLNLNYVEELTVENNDALTTLNFSNVSVPTSTLVDVLVSNNENLTSITGLNGFSHFNSLELINNTLLTDVSGLDSITEIDNCLQIYNNDDLTNLNFLSNLSTINCGTVCEEIFNNGSADSTNNLVIKNNFNLGDFCGLTDFFTNNGLCLEEFSISENGYNPTNLDIVNGNCTN